MILTRDELFKSGLITTVLDSSNDGINIVDIDGNIIYANTVSADYANSTKEYMLGQHISLFYEEAVLLQVLKHKKTILDQKIHYIGQKNTSSIPIRFTKTLSSSAHIPSSRIFETLRNLTRELPI